MNRSAKRRSINSRSINIGNIEILITDILILITEYFVLSYYSNSKLSIIFAGIALLINTLRIWFSKEIKRVLDWFINYRYIVAFVIFLILVFFQVNGSSIGVYDQLYGKADPSITTEIFGTGRLIRGDEWNVQVPYFFSQSYNGFLLNSDFMSISPQNMIIGYNAPVWDLTLIGKPFIWGYLLFGNSIGLSWYWCSKSILFVLVGYEMFYIMTRRKYLSLFSGLALVFSPVLQWWLAPHMYQVFFWSCSLYVVGYYFFTSEEVGRRVLFTSLAISCLVGFVVAVFPSLQVALGLLMLALLVGTLIRDRFFIIWNKYLAVQILTVLLVSGIIIGIFLLESVDAIRLLNNTVYPGKRISVGGNYDVSVLFTNPSVAITPFQDPGVSNACELSTFNQLGILFLIAFPYLVLLNKKYYRDSSLTIGYVLCTTMLIEIYFMLIGIPEIVAKLTLFSYINRMDMVYGFTAYILTFWSISKLYDYRERVDWKVGIIISLTFIVFYLFAVGKLIDPLFQGLVGRGFYYAVAVSFGIAGFILFTIWRNLFFSLFASWTIITGMLVNPIVIGASSVSNHDLIIACKQEADISPNARWLALNSRTTQELLLANGIKVLNGVNFYPDIEKWEIIDPSGKYDSIYNRYAHIVVDLTNQETSMDLIAADSIAVHLNIGELQKLGIEYVIGSPSDNDLMLSAGIRTSLIYSDMTTGDNVYALEY